MLRGSKTPLTPRPAEPRCEPGDHSIVNPLARSSHRCTAVGSELLIDVLDPQQMASAQSSAVRCHARLFLPAGRPRGRPPQAMVAVVARV
jgi:hypothetical protein